METNRLKKMVEAEMKKRGLQEQEMMGESNPMVEMISKLRFAVEQTQVYHWQSQSYSEHIALNEYYDGLPDLVDGIVESYQGKYGIQTGYKMFELRVAPLLTNTMYHRVVALCTVGIDKIWSSGNMAQP